MLVISKKATQPDVFNFLPGWLETYRFNELRYSVTDDGLSMCDRHEKLRTHRKLQAHNLVKSGSLLDP